MLPWPSTSEPSSALMGVEGFLGLASWLQVQVLVPWFLAMVFGVFVGATPGLTATMAVALIVPMSFYMPDPSAGLAMVIGVSFTAIFAGDIPATFIRIPGTPASAAATLDGYALARQGRADLALKLDLICSAVGGLLSVLLLIFLAPQLARFALRFSHYEYFWLAISGLAVSAMVSVGSARRGFLAAGLGMLLAMVGIDVVSGVPRFTFRQTELMGGLGFIPVMIGVFGLSEVLRNVCDAQAMAAPILSRGAGVSNREVGWELWRNRWLILKSSLLGTGVGALPGAGADIAAWVAYGMAQRTSQKPEQFGSGSVEGVVAPTSANNAAVGGAWIPALVFGIPGDSVTAIVLGAMMMYDLKPGPLIFERSAAQVETIFGVALLTQLFLLPVGYLGIKAFAWILRLPRSVVLSGVVLFSVVGAYALRNSLFDVWVMGLFGVVGFYLERQKVPVGPMVLGLILGPMVEENCRTGLIKSGGSAAPFFTRPLCLVFLGLLVLSVAWPAWMRWRRRVRTQVQRP